jgi:hypothetical protein
VGDRRGPDTSACVIGAFRHDFEDCGIGYAEGVTLADFAAAAADFADRLEAAGWPRALVWARVTNVTRGRDGEVVVYLGLGEERDEDARRAFEEARAGGAAAFAAVCTLGEATCATVEPAAGVADTFTIPTTPLEGSARWPVC